MSSSSSERFFKYLSQAIRFRLCLFFAVAALAILVPAWLVHYSAPAHAQDTKFKYQRDLEKVFSAHEDLRLDPETVYRARTSGQLSLITLSNRFDLQLQPNDLRAKNYRAEEVIAGVTYELPRSAVNTYKGTVNGLPGTDARFTIDASGLEGMIIALDDIYFVEQASKYSPLADASDYLLYKASDVRPDISPTCADTLNERISFKAKELAPESASIGLKAFFPLKVVEIATEADGEFVSAVGNATAANSDILGTLNQIDAIYRRDIGLTFAVVFQHAWSDAATDPYVESGDAFKVVDEFKRVWDATIPNPRDVAHMWTGRSLGGAAGFAFQGVVCQTRAPSYGATIRVTTAPFKTGIPAHEIAHNFNANHCDGQAGCNNSIMVSSLTTDNTLTFCQFSIDEITNYVNAHSGCLGAGTASTIQFNLAAYPATETNAQVGSVTVTRLGDASGAASVNYSTSDAAGLQSCALANGRASERCDYVTSVGTLRFAAGESSKTINIPLIDDVYVEGAETFTVSLSNAVGATLGPIVSATVTITDNDVTPSTANPIDGVNFFIRQQYLDILNRQPDGGGFQNWVDTLGPCPNGGFGEPPTSSCDRLHVAAGFFQSDEFLNRGYFAFRFYMVSFAQRPTYAQFIPDLAEVGGSKSPAEEEASKVAYADAFVQRPAFLARYPGLSGQALADRLLATAGLTSGYNAGSQTNGQILRGIAESSTAFNKFLSEGTVSIMYFGFQRRDPDASGYQNNVNTLNASPSNLRHMIFIFIYSTEYRSRFGPN